MFTDDLLFDHIGKTSLDFSPRDRIHPFSLQDKYVLLSMVMLCVVCAWHAIIAICPQDVAPRWDFLALISLAVIYTLFHCVFFLWMYLVVRRKAEAEVEGQRFARLDLPAAPRDETQRQRIFGREKKSFCLDFRTFVFSVTGWNE